MPNLRPTEILLIILVILLLFGARKLPELARSVGKSLKILKSEVKDLHDDEPDARGRAGGPSPTTDGAAPDPAPMVIPVAGESRSPASDHSRSA